MIEYYKKAFGLNLILRFNGSAVYRGTVPGLCSAAFVILLRYGWTRNDTTFDTSLQHPYALGVLVASLSLLLVFRVQQGYARYWEACSATHHVCIFWFVLYCCCLISKLTDWTLFSFSQMDSL